MKQVLDDVVCAVFCYNQEAYIEEAIKSVYEQTVWPRKLYILDDHSQDRSVEIIKQCVKAKPDGLNIEVIFKEKNAGLTAQYNTLRSKSFENTLIVTFDGDDIAAPERIETLYSTWKSAPDINLILSQFNQIDSVGDVVCERDESEVFTPTFTNIIEKKNVLAAGCSHAIDSSLFKDFSAINTNVIHEDCIFLFRAYLKGQIVKIRQPLLNYRVGVGLSALTQNSPEEYIRKFKIAYSRENDDLAMYLIDAKHMGRDDILSVINERKIFISFLKDVYHGAFKSKFQAWKAFFSQGVAIKRFSKVNIKINKYFRYSSET